MNPSKLISILVCLCRSLPRRIFSLRLIANFLNTPVAVGLLSSVLLSPISGATDVGGTATATEQSQPPSQDAIAVLTAQNYRVLSGRVHAILSTRFQGLQACPVSVQETFSPEFRSLSTSSEKSDEVIRALQLFLDSKKISDRDCLKALDQAESNFHSDERKRFRWISRLSSFACSKDGEGDMIADSRSCYLGLQQVLADLDPHCVSLQVTNPKDYYDPFPCMAGDYVLGRDLYEIEPLPESLISESQNYFSILRREISFVARESRSTPVDLYNAYAHMLGDTQRRRQRFMALLTMVFASTNSYSSYIKGFHDYFWRAHLLRTADAKRTLRFFNSSRLLIDELRTLVEWAIRHGVDIQVAGRKFSDVSRHDFMAAALSCHYSQSTRVIRKWIPIGLGYAYESFDFVTHLQGGDSVSESLVNFRVDTRRYRIGVQWGARFCDFDTSLFIVKSPNLSW